MRRRRRVSRVALLLVIIVLMPFADPNAPKRGLSAYMFFANDQRDNVREENPGISFGMHSYHGIVFAHLLIHSSPPGQVGKLLGERWKALDEKQRAPYDAKAATDKKRYEEEKKNYTVWIYKLRNVQDQNANLIIG